MTTQTDRFNELKNLILRSNIPFEERERFVMFFSQADNDLLLMALDVFKDDNWMARIYDNYKNKEEALIQKNWEKWDKVMQDEQDVLRSAQDAESNI